jgi:uncharacterized protein with FMN-binding domain
MDVDVISGATITCIGINAAAQAALNHIRASSQADFPEEL